MIVILEIIFAMKNAVLRAKYGMRILVRLSELTEEQQKYWIEMIDLLILNSDGDKKLTNGLRLLDAEALRRKISVYDMSLALYDKAEAIKKIESWKKAKEL